MSLHNKKTSAGFTLMELVAAVAIVGILAAIAVPSYMSYIARGNRVAAQRALLELSSQQEQFFLRNRRYATAEQLLGDSDGYHIDRRSMPTAEATSQLYAITMTSTNGYVLTATAQSTSGQAGRDPDCLSFSISATGERTATTPVCWGD